MKKSYSYSLVYLVLIFIHIIAFNSCTYKKSYYNYAEIYYSRDVTPFQPNTSFFYSISKEEFFSSIEKDYRRIVIHDKDTIFSIINCLDFTSATPLQPMQDQISLLNGTVVRLYEDYIDTRIGVLLINEKKIDTLAFPLHGGVLQYNNLSIPDTNCFQVVSRIILDRDTAWQRLSKQANGFPWGKRK